MISAGGSDSRGAPGGLKGHIAIRHMFVTPG